MKPILAAGAEIVGRGRVCRGAHRLALLGLVVGVFSPGCSGGSVARAEYRLDGGVAEPMAAVATNTQPAFQEISFVAKVPTAQLSVGPHWVEVRMRNEQGVWCAWQGYWIRVAGDTHLSAAEWFVDTDPGPGGGTPIPQPADSRWDSGQEERVVEQATVDALAVGRHRLFVRARDSNGDWGLVSSTTFHVAEPLRLVAAEWKRAAELDVARHPEPQGYAMKAVDGATDGPEERFVGTGTAGQLGPLCSTQTLGVRVQDNWGRWSTWRGLEWNPGTGQWRFQTSKGWEHAAVPGVTVVPQRAEIQSPADLALINSGPVTLEWRGGEGADGFDVFFAQQAQPFKAMARGLAASPFTVTTTLVPGRAAFWKVRSVAAAGCYADGPVWVLGVPGPGDVDGDGMPDAWEEAWFGTRFLADPRTDLDNDGFPDWAEYFALTDPTDPMAHLVVDGLMVSPMPRTVIVSWDSVPERLYSLMSSTNLAAPWKILYEAEGTGERLSFTNRFPPAAFQYYQVAVEPR